MVTVTRWPRKPSRVGRSETDRLNQEHMDTLADEQRGYVCGGNVEPGGEIDTFDVSRWVGTDVDTILAGQPRPSETPDPDPLVREIEAKIRDYEEVLSDGFAYYGVPGINHVRRLARELAVILEGRALESER